MRDWRRCNSIFDRSQPFAPACPKETSMTTNLPDLELLVTRTMPFGKYKGRVLADLPGNYLNWFAREGFPHGEIGRLLALMQEIDHNGLKSMLDPLRLQASRDSDAFGA